VRSTGLAAPDGGVPERLAGSESENSSLYTTAACDVPGAADRLYRLHRERRWLSDLGPCHPGKSHICQVYAPGFPWWNFVWPGFGSREKVGLNFSSRTTSKKSSAVHRSGRCASSCSILSRQSMMFLLHFCKILNAGKSASPDSCFFRSGLQLHSNQSENERLLPPRSSRLLICESV